VRGVGEEDGGRREEGIPHDSVISEVHTALFMEMSTLRIINYKSIRSRKSNIVAIEEGRLLECYAVWLLYESTFRRNLAPPSSR
jgi:hypothetical protein